MGLGDYGLSCYGSHYNALRTFIYFVLNKSWLTDSYIGFTLKMESVSKNTIFAIKMMVKSGLEKVFFKFLHALTMFITTFVLFIKTPPFYEVNSFNRKRLGLEEFKKYFM